jgi:hypothetical protein
MKGPLNHIKPIDNIFAEFSDPIEDEATGILLGFRQVRLLGIFRAAFKGAFVLTSEAWNRGVPAVSIRVLLAASGSEYGNPLSGEFLVGTKLTATLTASEIGHPPSTRTEEFIVPASETTIDKVGISLAGSFEVAAAPNHIKPIDYFIDISFGDEQSDGDQKYYGSLIVTVHFEEPFDGWFALAASSNHTYPTTMSVVFPSGAPNQEATCGPIFGRFVPGEQFHVTVVASEPGLEYPMTQKVTVTT